MKRWAAVAVACGCMLVLLATTACGGGGGSSNQHLTSPTVAIDETVAPLPTATPRQAQTVTGIAQVDAFLSALQVSPARERRQAIEPLIGYQQRPCSYTASLLLCRPGEQEGALVPAFPFKSCNDQSPRPDEIEPVLILLADVTVYAVYPPAGDFAQTADYVAIVYRTVGGNQQAAAVGLKGGHITSYTDSCTKTPKDYVQSLGLQDPVYQAQTP